MRGSQSITPEELELAMTRLAWIVALLAACGCGDKKTKQSPPAQTKVSPAKNHLFVAHRYQISVKSDGKMSLN